ncbi:MAG: serine hydrolase [Firmicutes bacterium]|nr:serine hydrolase [Bacillota bacterium]
MDEHESKQGVGQGGDVASQTLGEWFERSERGDGGSFDEAAMVREVQAGMRCSTPTAAALFVMVRGQVVAEWYGGPGGLEATATDGRSRFNVYSVRKSFIGLVAASLVHKGGLPGLDEPVRDYFDGVDRQTLALTSLRHLVTHTHGLEETANGVSRRHAAGERWHYNNAGVTLLCRMIEKLTGETVADHLDKLVLRPFGFGETGFETAAKPTLVPDANLFGRSMPFVLGVADGAGRNLYMSARELCAWGHLHLCALDPTLPQPGWRLDAGLRDALAMSVAVQTPASLDRRLPRQGFFWWMQQAGGRGGEIGSLVPPNSAQMVGQSGCLCLVVPALSLVAVRMYNGVFNRLTFVAQARAFGDATVRALRRHTP